MVRINEDQPIRSILERADKVISSDSVAEGWKGVAVEVGRDNSDLTSNNDFEGTLLYFPGVHLKEIMQ